MVRDRRIINQTLVRFLLNTLAAKILGCHQFPKISLGDGYIRSNKGLLVTKLG